MPEAGQNQLDVGQLELRPRVNSPRVISSFPLPGQSNVPVGMALPVILRFSRGMDPATLLPAVRVFPDSDFRLHLGPNSHPDSDEATLVIEILNTDDRRPIRFNTAYEVSVSTAATDREGNPLAETYTLNFRTGGFSVIATDPANGEQQAPFGASIGITLEFNTRIRPESVRDGNIQIRPRPDTSPQFSLIEDPVTGWTTVRILTRLLPNRQYSVTVGRGVRAANGAPLTNSPYRFTFRTRSDNSR
jgi:hypothetical protein